MRTAAEIRKSLPSNFCPVPFTTLLLDPAGQVGMCRHHGQQTFIGNIKNNTILEIWNSEKAIQWRKEFLQNNVKICDPLLFDRRCNLTNNWNDLLPYAELSEIQTQPFLRLTANLNGRCNLTCQTCKVWEMPNGLYTEENFWGPAKEAIFPYLKYVDMLGGEPFFQSDTFRLMEEVHAVNPDCLWDITTNMHWQHKDKILDKINLMNFKNINISLDSLIPEIFNKIRKPGRLDVFLKNLELLLSARDQKKNSFEISLNCVVQKDNWTELKNILNFCEEREIKPHFFHVRDPFEFSLLDLDQSQRIKILDFYLSTFVSSDIAFMYRVITPLINSLPSEYKAGYLVTFNEILKNARLTRSYLKGSSQIKPKHENKYD
ncbi:SPASM domain-containing protein [bacterium]|nr:SPASM domain-containing protein [bacterium]